MSHWTPKYTQEQRSAVERAYSDLRIRPVTKICALALNGELTADPGGEPVPGFEIPKSSVVYIGQTADRRKAGKSLPRELAKIPPRDRAETLQLRLQAIIDRDLTRVEKRQLRFNNEAADAEHLRKLARALRELATLPSAHEKRLPRAPGEQPNGQAPDYTEDSLAGKILAASDRSRDAASTLNTKHDQPAPQSPTQHNTDSTVTTQHWNTGDPTALADAQQQHHSATEEGPDSAQNHAQGLVSDQVLVVGAP